MFMIDYSGDTMFTQKNKQIQLHELYLKAHTESGCTLGLERLENTFNGVFLFFLIRGFYHV